MNSNEQGSRIDFKTLLAQREFNYLRLLKLMPSLENNDHFQFCYHPAPSHHLQLSLEVTHRAPYTLTVHIRQKANQNKLAIIWLQNMKVQLYIDVKTTEVIECNEQILLARSTRRDYEEYIQRLLKKARYDSFLADLLTFWINHAMAPENTLPDTVCQANTSH